MGEVFNGGLDDIVAHRSNEALPEYATSALAGESRDEWSNSCGGGVLRWSPSRLYTLPGWGARPWRGVVSVLQQFGHMFAPRPEVAMSEMLRVLKSGGPYRLLHLAPELLVGRMFLVARYSRRRLVWATGEWGRSHGSAAASPAPP